MEAVLLVIHLIVALSIIAIVLIQPSEAGGFLGSSGSMSNMMMPRRSGDILSRLTTILAGCFFMTSLLLAIVASHHTAPKSILDEAGDTPAPVTAPAGKTEAPAVKVETAPAAKADKKPEAPTAPISK